jgi:hypothetical protein
MKFVETHDNCLMTQSSGCKIIMMRVFRGTFATSFLTCSFLNVSFYRLFHRNRPFASIDTIHVSKGDSFQDLPLEYSKDIFRFCEQSASRFDEMEEMLTKKTIWKQWLVDIGTIQPVKLERA